LDCSFARGHAFVAKSRENARELSAGRFCFEVFSGPGYTGFVMLGPFSFPFSLGRAGTDSKDFPLPRQQPFLRVTGNP
jgi:hypothetical protein